MRLEKNHAKSDFLSQISEKINPKSIDDGFPNVQLFNFNITPPKYAKVIQYLTKGTYSIDYSDKQTRE